MIDLLQNLYEDTGLSHISWQMSVMWLVVFVLLYLAICKKFEPLLLVPIAFGALIANLPTAGIMEGLEFAGQLYEEMGAGAINSDFESVTNRVPLADAPTGFMRLKVTKEE